MPFYKRASILSSKAYASSIFYGADCTNLKIQRCFRPTFGGPLGTQGNVVVQGVDGVSGVLVAVQIEPANEVVALTGRCGQLTHRLTMAGFQ